MSIGIKAKIGSWPNRRRGSPCSRNPGLESISQLAPSRPHHIEEFKHTVSTPSNPISNSGGGGGSSRSPFPFPFPFHPPSPTFARSLSPQIPFSPSPPSLG